MQETATKLTAQESLTIPVYPVYVYTPCAMMTHVHESANGSFG